MAPQLGESLQDYSSVLQTFTHDIARSESTQEVKQARKAFATGIRQIKIILVKERFLRPMLEGLLDWTP